MYYSKLEYNICIYIILYKLNGRDKVPKINTEEKFDHLIYLGLEHFVSRSLDTYDQRKIR